MRIRTGFTALLAFGMVFALVQDARAAILMEDSLHINLTDIADATAKAEWGASGSLDVTPEGLGWDGDTGFRDAWLITKPVPLGLSWRPPYAVYLRVDVQPGPKEYLLTDGQTQMPYAGDVYVRYSADREHWSTWQVITQPCGEKTAQEPGRHYSGHLRVPNRNRKPYDKYLSEYSKLDVPWTSDEEAAAKWILEKESDFFAENQPLIGYVQFLFEWESQAGQRIRTFDATLNYGMGGLHQAPKDPVVFEKRNALKWRFGGDKE